ncbi:TetR/AcrR family transcriptional regulator [Quadrisphaera oryzae]|uniref:TetR/AcrR family transcriptional regulator n=1 Tax=Quadrisphaera TaxID=317661 RepID=UPI00164699EA|nr:TetR/AcrR family transcriptional regulator [Quadrisphaera sp. RL12-1S]MBC3760754.1 TetR/AcrR family transcriptional regulator [Quadrisphaera sp. RL12-1S]
MGLTSDTVVDAALELTRSSHLYSWSVRDLARRLDVAPSVLYHHVGGKDLLARRVVERVLLQMRVPSGDLDWEEYFRSLLLGSYGLFTTHPGVSKWLIVHGPVLPAALPVVDRGVAALQRAGFGEHAAMAYALLLNNAVMTVSAGDDRLQHEDDGPRDHAAIMAELERHSASSPGASVLLAGVRPFAGVDAAAERERYYRFVVESTINGLRLLPASTVPPGSGSV